MVSFSSFSSLCDLESETEQRSLRFVDCTNWRGKTGFLPLSVSVSHSFLEEATNKFSPCMFRLPKLQIMLVLVCISIPLLLGMIRLAFLRIQTCLFGLLRRVVELVDVIYL